MIYECFCLFDVEKAFDLPCLDNENMIETREIVQFGNHSFAKSFVSITARKLDENLAALFENETRNPGELFRILFLCVGKKGLRVSRV